jgi:chemotaxis protein methyltransferase CheR
MRRIAPGKNSRHWNDSLRAHPVKDTDCTEFLQWALPRFRMRWPGFRRVRGQVCKRLGRRLAELGLKNLVDYRALLEMHSEEWTRLDGLCRISISRFYRDQGVWRTLEREILPRLAERARARGDRKLRIWSAGCASGEEPYTKALLFAFGEAISDCRPEILATDADPHLLERARRACCPTTSLRNVPESWRAAFERFGEEYRLRPGYRRPVRFLEQDIRHAFPESRFDLILCRNLAFTYFETPVQTGIARRLAERLETDGMLLLGIHESLPESVPMLVQERPWLYCKREELGEDVPCSVRSQETLSDPSTRQAPSRRPISSCSRQGPSSPTTRC